MVVKRSALENGKQQKNPRINQSYVYGAIYENVPKLRIFPIFQGASFNYPKPNIR